MRRVKFNPGNIPQNSLYNNDMDVSNMQKDLVAVTEWTKQWGMRLN